ncbi:predicted protein [Sclerotinia sclerotiorum 1980 UF-70]|uniref:Uncharacterized protein n=1 Tax=Sclerotinia sclerotiorum (strain ATCC 18683 / 1980 / Ss-1) TaxID=665079 RepID=A7EWZ7_SCLS1|nr:predicted protein [Sclerotinia sclerotiorum 1980 UF-70]EDN93989.1 predicted protein [Sclerotinia sclerotiorum 1980 UF-70]
MSQILPEVQPAHEMTSPEIKHLIDELYIQLQSLKMKAISEFYGEYRENMIGCLWEFPSNPTDGNRLTCVPNNQAHEKRLIWIPIDQTLPSIDDFSECTLRELRMILQQNPVKKRVRVKCLNHFEHRGYELGLDFTSPRVNCKVRDRLMVMIYLYKTKGLSVNDIEVVFMMGPKAVGWTWCCTGDFSSSKLPNLRNAVEVTGKVELNNWKETELEALDKSVEQGSVYLEPINSTSKGGKFTTTLRFLDLSDENIDSEIRDADIEEGEIVETISISEVSSRTDEARLSNIETSDDERANPFKSLIGKLLHEHGTREFPEPQDEPWLRILQKHGIPKADYTNWLKFDSCNFERPPTPKDNGISSTSLLEQPSSTLQSALPIPSVSFQKAKPKAQVPSSNEMMSLAETSVPTTVLQIRQEFVDHQSNIFDSVYGQLLERCTLEANELLEERHNFQIATLNTKLLEVGQEKIALEDQTLILQDQLKKKSNELNKLKDEFMVKNADTQKYIDPLCLERTTAKEKEKVEEESLALLENGKPLQRELNESKARLDEMDLANSKLSQEIEELNKEKNEAKANSIMWKERFEAKSWEMDSKFAEWRQAFTNMNTWRLEMAKKMNNLKSCIPELTAMNEAWIASAKKIGERIGREMALQDLKFDQEKEFDAIKRAHLEQIQLVWNTEYYRGLRDGQGSQINEKISKSMAANPTMDRKELVKLGQNMDQNMHKQMAVGASGCSLIAPKRFAHSPMQSYPIQPAHIQSPVISTSAPVSVDHFNFDYELGLLPQSPGSGIIPSRLSVFNHAFLREVFDGLQQDFWSNDNMQLMLDRKHGALLLIHDLDEKVFVGNEYPIFLNTVQGHAVYIGQYKIVKQIVNNPSVHPLGIKFDNYLGKNQLKTQRGICWSKEQFGNKRPFRGVYDMLVGLEKDRIETSWTVFEYVGFDLENYEKLLLWYSQIEPFCNRKKGIPLIDVEGGFEHGFLNELLVSSSLKKRMSDAEDLSGGDRKRVKMSRDDGILKSSSVQEVEDLDDSTIVVNVSPRRFR